MSCKMIQALASAFRTVSREGNVAINTPFSGGFISNAHTGIKVSMIQVEINRFFMNPKYRYRIIRSDHAASGN